MSVNKFQMTFGVEPFSNALRCGLLRVYNSIARAHDTNYTNVDFDSARQLLLVLDNMLLEFNSSAPGGIVTIPWAHVEVFPESDREREFTVVRFFSSQFY